MERCSRSTSEIRCERALRRFVARWLNDVRMFASLDEL